MTGSGTPDSADSYPGRIYDWNEEVGLPRYPLVMDETLRDGIQSASSTDPPIETKFELLRMMARLGMDCATVGYPASRARQFRDGVALAKLVAQERLAIQLHFIARAVDGDVDTVAEVSQQAGTQLGIGIFVGSSPFRLDVEGWDLDHIARVTENAVSRAVKRGLSVLFVTEDSSRTPPNILERLYLTAVRAGAGAVCIADTVGHATPAGAARLVRFVRGAVDRCRSEVLVDWHGHSDRGLALANSLSAWAAGADRCHGTALGVGERSGNAPVELLLLNLVLEEQRTMDLTSLPAYVSAAAAALGYAVPPNNPVAGRDAFRTAAGVHAAAIRKAIGTGDPRLADYVYSGFSASRLGRRQVIDVGPQSGMANVEAWCAEHDIVPDKALAEAVLLAAKERDEVLTDDEIYEVVSRATGEASRPLAPGGRVVG